MAHYETTDIFKGAFLLSSGGDLSGIRFNDRKIASFAVSLLPLQEKAFIGAGYSIQSGQRQVFILDKGPKREQTTF